MGLRALRRIIILVCMLLLTPSGVALAFQDNAVGGSVRAKGNEMPLGDVKVTVAQDESINDQTRDEDGVYVLRVRKSLKTITIVYELDGYGHAYDYDVRNEQGQQKRPIVWLTPTGPDSVSKYSDAQLDEVVARSNTAISRGREENLPLLAAAGAADLESLRRSGMALSGLAKSNLDKANTVTAELQLERALAVYRKVPWHDTQTLTTAAGQLSIAFQQNGDLVKAADYARLARGDFSPHNGQQPSHPPQSPKDFFDSGRGGNSGFTIMAQAFEVTGLREKLKGEGPFTIFAPTDAAFQKLPPGRLETLFKPENRSLLESLLLYHIVHGKLSESDLLKFRQTPASLTTFQGTSIRLGWDDKPRVNNARLFGKVSETQDGIIYSIDEVLIPATGGGGK